MRCPVEGPHFEIHRHQQDEKEEVAEAQTKENLRATPGEYPKDGIKHAAEANNKKAVKKLPKTWPYWFPLHIHLWPEQSRREDQCNKSSYEKHGDLK